MFMCRPLTESDTGSTKVASAGGVGEAPAAECRKANLLVPRGCMDG
jgi:hypothetical protein